MRASLVFVGVVTIWVLWASSVAADYAADNETFGCEANPTGNPIGGGEGYNPIFTTGDYTVTSLDELLAALNAAQPGEIVFVPDGVEIELTGHQDVSIPQQVTLAGTRGLNGSAGARLFTTWRKSHTMFRSGGYGVRVTGLRIEGPYGERETVSDHSGGISIRHSNCQVDNCEVSCFSYYGVGGAEGILGLRVHHNYIHHCQRSGYGYGVAASGNFFYVIANRFDSCRHHIASSGQPGSGYEAAWNFCGPNANSHNFDMHGGKDRGDGTKIAGDYIHIHHNTFQSSVRSINIRGIPSQGAEIHHNWLGPAKGNVTSGGNTKAWQNLYGPEKTLDSDPIDLIWK